MLVAYCRLCRHCCNLAEGGCLLSQFHFTRCRYFLGHVACRNLPWQGLYDLFSLSRTRIPDFNRYWEQTPFCGQERIKLELYPLLLSIITCFLLKSCLEYPLECTLQALQAQRLSSSFQLLVQRVYFGSLRLLRG